MAALNVKSMNLLKRECASEEMSAARICFTANSAVEQQCKGQPPHCLSADEETLVAATAESKGSHSQPVQLKSLLAAELNSMLENKPDGLRSVIAGGAKRKSQLLAFACDVICHVN